MTNPYRIDLSRYEPNYDFTTVIRGQSPGAGGGGGAADATDPSAILTQLQIQNVFTPSTYDSSGYSNNLILQPVLPFPVAIPGLKEFFPAHILRPTLPIISPSADPDGPAGVEGGLGDLTVLDAYVHNLDGFGTMILGYTAILPTATHKQLGLREFQIGPAAALLYKEIPKTLLGFVYQQPFSWESDAQQVLFQPILVRHLPDQWYVRWGELSWTFNTDNGDYNVPLNMAIGKIIKIGEQSINVFIQPLYTRWTPQRTGCGVGRETECDVPVPRKDIRATAWTVLRQVGRSQAAVRQPTDLKIRYRIASQHTFKVAT